MARFQAPAIIAFANQKGGVGKSTLCACFANYLVCMGVRVRVVDCDRQLSIFKSRRRDIRSFGEETIPYSVEKGSRMNQEGMMKKIMEVINDKGADIVLFDCPGSLNDILIPLILNSHIIVIPFHYDDMSIAATAEFVIFIEQAIAHRPEVNPTRVFFIPNMGDKRIGTREELIKWEAAREEFELHGTVTPKIFRKAEMERFSTIADLDKQTKNVKPAFDKIYYELFGNLSPAGPSFQFIKSNKMKADPAGRRDVEEQKDSSESNTLSNQAQDVSRQVAEESDNADESGDEELHRTQSDISE